MVDEGGKRSFAAGAKSQADLPKAAVCADCTFGGSTNGSCPDVVAVRNMYTVS